MEKSLIIIAEQKNGQTLPVTYELVSLAKQIPDCRIVFAVLETTGDAGKATARHLADSTGLDVITLPVDGDGPLTGETCLLVLADFLSRHAYDYICVPHTSLGIDYAARLALRLDAACISCVNAVSAEAQKPLFQRAVYGGKLNECISSDRQVTVLTALPGVFPLPAFSQKQPGQVTIGSTAQPSAQITHLERISGGEAADGLTDARVVVAAGNGIGEKAHLELIYQLAERFARSAVAGSRPVCDRGWLPYNRQVGVTGVQVSPDLYIACGISGAYQHVVGMQGSGLVVAINTDPKSAIFNAADLGIVADLKEFIPAFLEVAAKTGKE